MPRAATSTRADRLEAVCRLIPRYDPFKTAGGYGGWLHGEAVAAGMVCASRLGELRGLIPAELSERQVRLLRAFGLPTAPEAWDAEGLIATMRTDKKAVAGRMRFILPRRLGEVALYDDVPEDQVRQVLKEVRIP